MANAKTGKRPVLRRCAGCMQYMDKMELYRFFVSDTGEIDIDESSKAGGRGAYICKNNECLEKAFKRHALDRSFKMKLQKDEYNRLLGLINTREKKDD